jgi:ketosteroid isomerase-like protein
VAVGAVGAGERARGKWTTRPRIDHGDRRRRVGIDDPRVGPRVTRGRGFDAAAPGDDQPAENISFLAPLRSTRHCVRRSGRAFRRGLGGAAPKPIAITDMTTARTICRGHGVGKSAGAPRARAVAAGRAVAIVIARAQRTRG